MDGKIVLVSHKEFMELFMFMPRSPIPEGLSASLDLQSIPVERESEMYPPLMEKLNTPGLAPGYRFVATPNRADPNDTSSLRVDGGMYPETEYPEDGRHTSWSRTELLIECKTGDVTGDPFDDTRESGEPNSDERRKVLGQVMAYACRVFKKQHRKHQFTLMVLGSSARIIYWDRSGVVATKKFNYKKEPEKLVGFIWIFARLPARERGIDPTVIRVEERSEDWKLMQDRSEKERLLEGTLVAVQEHARKAFKTSLAHSDLWKVRVDERSPSDAESETVITSRYFLVGKPTFVSDGLSGRGTRGYVAIDLSDREGPFVFLKDVWRVDHPGIRREGEILGFLNERGVQSIPTRLYHGDVDPLCLQTTLAQNVWKAKHPKDADKCPLKTHTHYRMVVREVGLPMDEFKDGKELIYLVTRCIGAHWGAYQQGILHRDISSGNVLISIKESIDRNGNLKQRRDGLLTDWELAKDINATTEVPRQPNRTGTWKFLSANILWDCTKKVTVEDELESFFHLVLYYSLRYLPNNCPDVTIFMHDYFDGFSYALGQYTAGNPKLHAVEAGALRDNGVDLQFFTAPPTKDAPDPPLHPINNYFRAQLIALKTYYTICRADHGISRRSGEQLGTR
ncbi:hypothetical protein C8Q79DRAFT_758439 [Trametes meyenii]|nr:hypothetical protein C8Q79DRAFT_758439 [Trametes meyenii]